MAASSKNKRQDRTSSAPVNRGLASLLPESARADLEASRAAAPAKGPRQGGSKPRRDNRPGPPRSDVRYVLISTQASFEADVFESAMPLRWNEAGSFGALLKPGLYLQREGSLTAVSREPSFEGAVMFVMWEDPHQSFTTADNREVRPGLHAGFLVKSPTDEGPPFIPLILPIEPTPTEVERGLLSPWLDQVAAIRFNATLEVGRRGPAVQTRGEIEEEAGTDALLATMRWLAENPDDNSPAAAVARRILVTNGHGLQRLGVALMHESAATRSEAISTILAPLAPEVGELLQAIWTFFEEGQRPDGLRALIDTVAPALAAEHAMQTPSSIATLGTWMAGLFGARPDKENQQPARLLFWILQALRGTGRHVEAFDHSDAQLPAFPLTGASATELLRSLPTRVQDATPLEGLARCLALAEAGWELGPVKREHLRPFPALVHFTRRYPIASRTIRGRFDYLITGWSFRGVEVHSQTADLNYLSDDLLLDSPSVATARAYGRVLGARNRASVALAECTRRAGHPILERIAALKDREDSEILEQLETLISSGRLSRDTLYDTVISAEFLISAMEHHRSVEGFIPAVPDHPRDGSGLVRSHFMYWRVFCRSVRSEWSNVYEVFLDSMLPQLDTLPGKLQIEMMALLASWIKMTPENVAIAVSRGWNDIAVTTLKDTLDDPEQLRLGAERAQLAFRALAELGTDSYIRGLDMLAAHPAFEQVDVGRILALARTRKQRDDVLNAPSFLVIHRRLADNRTPAGAWGRGEWTRLAVERARRARSLQWLLDPARQSRLLQNPEFIEWFAHKGQTAIARPDDAYIELLEACLPLVDAPGAGDILNRLDAATSWGDAQIAGIADEAGHIEAALAWMRATGVTDADRASSMFRRTLATARSGLQLRQAAEALAFAERSGADVSAMREELLGAMASYAPMRQQLDGLVAVTTGWRLADLPCLNPVAANLAERAAVWFLDSGDARLLDWLAFFAQATLLESAASDAAGFFAGGEPSVDPSLARLLSVANKGQRSGGRDKRRQGRSQALMRALTDFDVQGLLGRQLLADLQVSGDAQALVDHVLHGTDDMNEETVSEADADLPDEATSDASEAEAEGSDDGEHPDDAAESDADNDAEPASAAAGSQKTGRPTRLTRSLRKLMRRVCNEWLAAQQVQASPHQPFFSTPTQPADWSLRTDILPRLARELRGVGLDPGDAIGAVSAFGNEAETANLTLDDLAVLAGLIAVVSESGGFAGHCAMLSRGVALEGVMLREVVETSGTESESSGTDVDASVDSDGSDDQHDGADDESTDDESTANDEPDSEEGTEIRTTTIKKARASKKELDRLWSALKREASDEASAAFFGDEALRMRYVALLARNPELTVITTGGRKPRARGRREESGIAWILRPPRRH